MTLLNENHQQTRQEQTGLSNRKKSSGELFMDVLFYTFLLQLY
ncbi:hypothetical protein STRDD11_01304 [Streptococcus sp. DD11]|nr:hypothetical protein STRDD11_01304 [Streptococcus sp. DD11]